MSMIKFNSDECTDCCLCLRSCPVKAIKIDNNRASIVEEMCILCGKCLSACPHSAKEVHENYLTVKRLIEQQEKVILSVAPSFISNFDVENFETLKQACLKLGFYDVQETSIGAHFVNQEYKKLLEKKEYINFITSSCPSLVNFIQQYYPSALCHVARVDSPMIAHGKFIKEQYKDKVIVVFVGPCLAKKKEASESQGIIDHAITFIELQKWFIHEGIQFEEKMEEKNDQGLSSRYYPIRRGVIKSLGEFHKDYEYLSVSGIEECVEVLENINSLEGMFLEMNICNFGCVGGPCVVKTSGGSITAMAKVRSFCKNNHYGTFPQAQPSNLTREHPLIPNSLITPSEEEILEILHKLGKKSEKDELNCKACGYSSCREKAISVFNNLSDASYCLPYLKNKAESISNRIIKSSPNGIVSIDDDLNVIEINDMAKKMFKIQEDIRGEYYGRYIFLPEFTKCSATGNNLLNKKIYIATTTTYAEVSIVVMKEHKTTFAIFKDVTNDEINQKKIRDMQLEMIHVTNKVIDKQMRTVQEIASLLGETTAETKVALLKFRNSLQDNE